MGDYEDKIWAIFREGITDHTIREMLTRISELEKELGQHQMDISKASGALMVDMPRPGSDLAKVMRVVRILKDERSELEASNAQLREALEPVGAVINSVMPWAINEIEMYPDERTTHVVDFQFTWGQLRAIKQALETKP